MNTDLSNSRVSEHMMGSELEISVIIPLPEHRGHWRESITSWVAEQDFDRSKYEVLLIGNGKQPDIEEAARQLLTASDRFLHLNSRDDFELYDYGAREARGRLLFFTEAHAVGTPSCLSEMARFLDDGDYVGGCCWANGLFDTFVGEMQERLCEIDIPVYSQPNHWHRIAERGSAVYKRDYLEVGGFRTEFGLFAERALGIELHKRGKKLGYVEQSRVKHFNSRTIHDFEYPTLDFVFGECEYRSVFPARHCQEYFGIPSVWLDRGLFNKATSTVCRKSLTRWLVSRLIQPGGLNVAAGLFPGLINFFMQSVIGISWPLTMSMLALKLAEYRLFFLSIFGRKHCCRAFREWHLLLVRHFRLRYLAQSTEELPYPRSRKTVHDMSMDDSRLMGFHEEEPCDSGTFRWSKPIAALKVCVEPGQYQLKVGILGHRTDLPAAHLEVYLDGNRLRLLDSDGVSYSWIVTPGQWANTNDHFLVFVCDPFLPALQGSPDERELGIPITHISLEEVSKHDQRHYCEAAIKHS